jgi:hypothetical protein
MHRLAVPHPQGPSVARRFAASFLRHHGADPLACGDRVSVIRGLLLDSGSDLLCWQKPGPTRQIHSRTYRREIFFTKARGPAVLTGRLDCQMRGGQRLPVKPHTHAGAARVFAPDEHRGGLCAVTRKSNTSCAKVQCFCGLGGLPFCKTFSEWFLSGYRTLKAWPLISFDASTASLQQPLPTMR